jgi:hypothetical protein
MNAKPFHQPNGDRTKLSSFKHEIVVQSYSTVDSTLPASSQRRHSSRPLQNAQDDRTNRAANKQRDDICCHICSENTSFM